MISSNVFQNNNHTDTVGKALTRKSCGSLKSQDLCQY